MKILVKSITDPIDEKDGFRVMVDENLPGGMGEDKAGIDMWPKEIGPSIRVKNLLRDNPDNWQGYCSEYARELERDKDLWVGKILQHARTGVVTLLYSDGTTEFNNAVIIREYILASREEFLLKKAA